MKRTTVEKGLRSSAKASPRAGRRSMRRVSGQSGVRIPPRPETRAAGQENASPATIRATRTNNLFSALLIDFDAMATIIDGLREVMRGFVARSPLVVAMVNPPRNRPVSEMLVWLAQIEDLSAQEREAGRKLHLLHEALAGLWRRHAARRGWPVGVGHGAH